MKNIDFFGKKLNVYKANFHSHSTFSDGSDTVEQLIEAYSARKYDILAITDHHIVVPVSQFDSKGMTMITGAEYHPMMKNGEYYHMLALFMPEDFKIDENPSSDSPYRERPPQDCIDKVVQAGGLMYIAHPYWCGLTLPDIMGLKNLSGIEVYNGECEFIAKGYAVQTWDYLIAAGMRYCGGLANDDVHYLAAAFNCWTMVLAEDKSPESVKRALATNSYYATQGPEITRMSLSDDYIFEAEFSPCTEVVLCSKSSRGFIGFRRGTNKEVSSCRIDLNRVKDLDLYFRLQIVDKEGRHAWSNPFYFNEK